jgi:hypothetical protein
MSKERPILFSGPMVRALLDGSKTQTRRILKRAVGPSLSVDCDESGVAELSWLHGDGPGHEVHERIQQVQCPYGVPGDRLWVRETHAEVFEIDIPAGRPVGPIGTSGSPARPDWKSRYVYAADGPMPNVQWHHVGDSQLVRWTPSIHMPRAASRITLDVTDVRVERLQEISEVDAAAEGVESLRNEGEYWKHYLESTASCDALICLSARESFRTLWDSLAAPGADWQTNPWLWVVEFKRI